MGIGARGQSAEGVFPCKDGWLDVDKGVFEEVRPVIDRADSGGGMVACGRTGQEERRSGRWAGRQASGEGVNKSRNGKWVAEAEAMPRWAISWIGWAHVHVPVSRDVYEDA